MAGIELVAHPDPLSRSAPAFVAAAFAWLAVATVRQARRHPERTRTCIALTSCALAAAMLFFSVEVGGRLERTLIALGTPAYMASGFGILLVRHSLAPVSRRTLAVVGVAFAVVTAVASAGSMQGTDSGVAMLAWLGASLLWNAVTGEAMIRFWRLSTGRPRPQRARMRALATALAAAIVLGVVIGAASAAGNSYDDPAFEIATGVLVLPVLGLLYVGFASPRWVRRMWRAKEETALVAASAPLFLAPDRRELAARAVHWAMRLLGAAGAALTDGRGDVLAAQGVGDRELAAFGLDNAVRCGPVVLRGDGGREVVAVPLTLHSSIGCLAAFSGPLTPGFGPDELALLAHYGDGVSAALNNVQLTEMKDTFLTAVSHELRTPLTAVLGGALTAERVLGAGLAPRDRALLSIVGRNAQKLERLLTDLLDLDRLNRGIIHADLRPTDLGELVARVVGDTSVRPDRRVVLHLEHPVVRIDPAKVERIVENLLTNALKHTDSTAHVWVSVRAQTQGALIIVEDDGEGVPSGMREKIFEAFVRGDGVPVHAPGIGIGLSLVARFAQLHGGNAWAEERPGGGSSFRVLLPGSDPTLRVAPARNGSRRPSRSGLANVR